MSEAESKADDIRDFLRPGTPSKDPEYLAWAENKIRRALEADLAAPDDAIPQHLVWKRFGLEY